MYAIRNLMNIVSLTMNILKFFGKRDIVTCPNDQTVY